MKQFKFFGTIAKIFPIGSRKITITIETSSHAKRQVILDGLSNLGVDIGFKRDNKKYVSMRFRNEETKK